jgi:hypothetical protein
VAGLIFAALIGTLETEGHGHEALHQGVNFHPSQVGHF